eukprot:2246291-Prymnesium_polylepis.1
MPPPPKTPARRQRAPTTTRAAGGPARPIACSSGLSLVQAIFKPCATTRRTPPHTTLQDAPHFLTLDETTLTNISPLGSGQSAGANAAA